MNKKNKQGKRYIRHKRIRSKVLGNKEKPRLCVFHSNQHIYAQLIDDEKSKTLAVASDSEIEKKKIEGNITVSLEVGKLIGKKAKGLKITEVVFDRSGYKYHGVVKALAEGARAEGLKF